MIGCRRVWIMLDLRAMGRFADVSRVLHEMMAHKHVILTTRPTPSWLRESCPPTLRSTHASQGRSADERRARPRGRYDGPQRPRLPVARAAPRPRAPGAHRLLP